MEIKELIRKIEAVSKTYAEQYKIQRGPSWYFLKLQEEMGELTQSYLMLKGKGRSKNKSKEVLRTDFEKEVADVFCHILLLARSNTVDIEKAVDEKWLSWYRKQMKKTSPKKSA